MKNKYLAIGLLLALASGGCAFSEPEQGSKTVVVATHDSWAADKKLIAEFEKQSGFEVKIRPQGDAGALTNKLVLTKDAPVADVAFGVDNTFASRALEAKVFAANDATLPSGAEKYALAEGSDRLVPVDYGDVCVNVDRSWFRKHRTPAPRTLDDLTKRRYRGLFVTPGATTSSPGLAFLLTTIAAKGDAWPDYWKALMKNDTKVVAGWTDAYTVDFTAGGGDGDRPIVLSYASSPPFTIPEGKTKPTTRALLDTCFRQVEYAGVLAGAKNPKGAEAFLQFLLEKDFQAQLPEQMYVFPVDAGVELPEMWAAWAELPSDPYTLPAAEIAKNRAGWVRQWRDLTSS